MAELGYTDIEYEPCLDCLHPQRPRRKWSPNSPAGLAQRFRCPTSGQGLLPRGSFPLGCVARISGLLFGDNMTNTAAPFAN